MKKRTRTKQCEEKMTEFLHCRIRPSLKSQCKIKAKKEGVALCAWISAQLKKGLSNVK